MTTKKQQEMNHILLWFLAIILGFVLTSCDIQKEATKTKSDTGFKENIESTVFRKGDTVHYEIPNVIYKDTTIYRTNRQGTTIKTVYDKTGDISSIDCFASAIAEIKKENREFQQNLLNKEAKKTENFDSSFIIYIMLGLVIIFCFGLFLGFLYLKNK
jgi:uncharacterized lipoprotein YehR (DUF1307 family)